MLPASTFSAVLAALDALGLPSGKLAAAAGVSRAALAPLDGTLPLEAFTRLWTEIGRALSVEEVVTEVALAIPYGAFGALDYLAGSAPSVAAATRSIAQHFSYVATSTAIEIEEHARGAEVRLVNAAEHPFPALADEFTLAVLISRFRSQFEAPPLAFDEVRLTRAVPSRPERFAELLRAPVRFGCKVAALCIPTPSWTRPLRSADPHLQATLRQLTENLGLGRAGDSDLELQVRSRLRLLPREGRSEASEVARALGLSERTLHRRLAASGTSYRKVLDGFREAEAERLIASGTVPPAEIALRLGFSDQTAYSRAFKRWKGMAPRQWAQTRPAR